MEAATADPKGVLSYQWNLKDTWNPVDGESTYTLENITEDTYIDCFVSDGLKDPGVYYYRSIDIRFLITVKEESADVLLGDVNGDSEVDANDLTALSRHVAKIEEITDEALLKAADVNSDSGVDANDLTLLSRYVAHIISSFSE